MTKGIDVSTWQGKIDWNQVKGAGIHYAILRSSFGSPDPSQVDNQFENNYKGAKAAGIPVGAYHYGYAVSEAEARQEARFFLDTIKGKQFEYPVYYDVEDNGTMGTLSRQTLTNVIKAFCSEVEKAGYYVGVYASLSWLDGKFYPDQLPYDVWAAQYFTECQYSGQYGMWQYTSSGSVPGIQGGVDMNECYQDYPKAIKEKGLNGFNKPTPTPAPAPEPAKTVDVYYRVRTKADGWLPEVKNLEDYAGFTGAVTDAAVRVSAGSVKYRVHIKGGNWLPYVTGCNINDAVNGYAGNGLEIDAVEVYYYTPDSIRPYKKAKYRVAPVGGSYYPWQYDNETGNGQDGYAGAFGNAIGKLQIVIE